MKEHLPAAIAMLGLLLFLLVIWFRKGREVIEITQKNWRRSNPVARAMSRRALQSLLNPENPKGRSEESVQWSRREAAKELLPQVLGTVVTLLFFAVKPGDISSSRAIGVVSSREFGWAVAFGVVLHTLFENVAVWMILERLLGTEIILGYKWVHSLLLAILGGSTKNRVTRYGILLGDMVWMYMVPWCTFPLFCSYKEWPPLLRGSDMELTCWVNWEHWFLVFLSAYSLMGIFVWTLSMVLRKSNWPADAYLHHFEGLFESADEDDDRGLRAQILPEKNGELSLKLMLKEPRPKDPSGRREPPRSFRELYEPCSSPELKGRILLPLEESPPAFQVLFAMGKEPDSRPKVLRDEENPEENPDENPEENPLKQPLLPDDASEDHDEPEAEVELKVEAVAAEDGGRDRLRISNPRADVTEGALKSLEGDWIQVAFLTTPHAVEPEPNFLQTILKVCATLTWSAYVPPHREEEWRLGFVACMVCITLVHAWISHAWKPSVFACVNTLNVYGMLAAVAVSLFSLVHASLVPPGSASTHVVSWILLFAFLVATVAGLGAIAWTLVAWNPAEDDLWHYLRELSDYVDKQVPLWDIHVGDDGSEEYLSVSQWQEGFQKMKDLYGFEDPSQILKGNRSVRIIEVCRRLPPAGASTIPGGLWVPYETWAKENSSQKEVLSRVYGGDTVDANETVDHKTYWNRVKVVPETHSWVSLVAMGKYRPHPKSKRSEVKLEKLDLCTKGMRLQDVPEKIPRVLALGVCGAGKSTLLAALGELTHANRYFAIQESSTAEGVTKDTTALKVGERVLLVDPPGVADGTKDKVGKFLSTTKWKLAGAPEDTGCITNEITLERQLFFNAILLTIRATEQRFSRLLEPLQVLERHFGSVLMNPHLVTVVFTCAEQVQKSEQQRRIVGLFSETFMQVFPQAPEDPLGLAMSQSDFDGSQIPCVFIETHAVLPDCAWKYTFEEKAAARRALKLIQYRISQSTDRRVPTSRWAPVLEKYPDAVQQEQELNLKPSFEYRGLPHEDPRLQWELKVSPEVDSLQVVEGTLTGSVPRAGYYNLQVSVQVAESSSEKGVVPIRTQPLHFNLQVSHTAAALEQRMKDELGWATEQENSIGAREVLEKLPKWEDSRVPNLWDAALLLRKRLELEMQEGSAALARHKADQLVCDVAGQVIAENERFQLMARSRDEALNKMNQEIREKDAAVALLQRKLQDLEAFVHDLSVHLQEKEAAVRDLSDKLDILNN